MIKRLVSKPVRHLLRQAGLELHRKGKPQALAAILELSDPCDAIYQHGDIAFEAPLSHCMYPYLFSYGASGWHPFVEVLKQYVANPALDYQDSVLHHYYRRFQPQNVLDVFFSPEEQGEELQGSSLAKLSIPPHNPIFPWDCKPSHISGERGLDASHGNQGFGPVSDAKGALEFQRLTHTLESVKLHGYRPGLGHDGEVRGYFLRAQDGYRFVIRQGLHRAAVLAALGYSHIRVKFYLAYPRAIFQHDLGHWPQVKQGYVDRDAALHIFHKFFEEDGRQRAARLGLLTPEAGVK